MSRGNTNNRGTVVIEERDGWWGFEMTLKDGLVLSKFTYSKERLAKFGFDKLCERWELFVMKRKTYTKYGSAKRRDVFKKISTSMADHSEPYKQG